MSERIGVTGTPGTGKTSATERLDRSIIHLNDVIRELDLYTERDEERDSLVADLERIGEWLTEQESGTGAVTVIESHLAHHFDADRVVVLRCRPDELERRLKERGESEAKARENREAEALDLILAEAVERRDAVYEIDTTNREPDEVAHEIERVIAGEREPGTGDVDFAEYL